MIDVDDLGLGQAGDIGGVFQRLPGDVTPGIVELVFDDDQLAVLIQRQQVEPLARVGEAVKLLLDDQQLFPEGVGLFGEPFLQMLPLPQVQIRKAPLFELFQSGSRCG